MYFRASRRSPALGFVTRIIFKPEGVSMKLSLYVLVRKLWKEHPSPGNWGTPRFPFSTLVGSILAVKDLSEKSRPNMSLWSCWEFRVRSGRFHSLYKRQIPFLLNIYIIWALFPDAVGAGGNGLISDPPKNCIFFVICQINEYQHWVFFKRRTVLWSLSGRGERRQKVGLPA